MASMGADSKSLGGNQVRPSSSRKVALPRGLLKPSRVSAAFRYSPPWSRAMCRALSTSGAPSVVCTHRFFLQSCPE